MNVCTGGKFLEYTHTEVTNAVSTVYPTLDYECRHKNKGTGIVLVLICTGHASTTSLVNKIQKYD